MEPTGRTTPLRPSPPPGTGVDLDPARRPGVPREREPRPWPNARYPPARMEGEPSALLHGRPGKRMPPVFSTVLPPRGVSGRIRRLAARYPDHRARHWLLFLAGDRIESMGHTTTQLLKSAAPGLLAVLGLRAMGASRNRKRRRERGQAEWSSAREAWGV